jgi:hypothetical protein
LDLPKIRYVYLNPLDASKTSGFFYRLGMIVSSEEFCSLPRWMPVWEQRLRNWSLPDDLHPEATLIAGDSVSKLKELIQCSPNRDFMLPDGLRQIITVDAAAGTHRATAPAQGKFFLLSKNSSGRPADSIAPGTVAPDQRR